MSNPYQPQDPNNPYGSQPEQNYQQPPYSGPTQAIGNQPPYGQPPSVQPPPPYGQMPVAYGQQGYYTPATVGTQRPAGVSVVAIWQYIVAFFLGVITVLLFFAGSLLSNAFAENEAALAGGVLVVFGIILLLFVALFIALGIGLWRMRSWAHITTMIVYSLSIALNLFGALGGNGIEGSSVVGLLIAIAIVVYLALPATRAAFRR
jgi:uncharacterized membrane protein (DUF2068 family)